MVDVKVDRLLQREAIHQKIVNSSKTLSQVFSTLFPSSIGDERSTLRLKVFSKIVSMGFIDFNDKNLIKSFPEFRQLIYRTSKKRILESLEDLKLIKKEKDNIYSRTQAGEAAWQSINHFLDNYDFKEEISDAGKYYEYVFREISVDDKGNSTTTTNFGLRNISDKWLKFIDPTAESDKGKFKGIFRIRHSENIKDYEVTVDEEYFKKIHLNFANPLKKGELVELWYEYEWHNKYPPKDKEWSYFYHPRRSLVKEFMLKFNFPKDFQILPESTRTSIEGANPSKDTIMFDPIIISNKRYQTLIWRIRNAHPGRRYTLHWQRKD